jgi:hypothetical protein
VVNKRYKYLLEWHPLVSNNQKRRTDAVIDFIGPETSGNPFTAIRLWPIGSL